MQSGALTETKKDTLFRVVNETDRKAAFSTLQAYNAVETTKRRQFMYLQTMDTRCNQFIIEASANENQMLARLLRDHDEQVSAFKTASNRLRNANPEAFDALWIYIIEINSTLDPLESKAVH